MKPVQPSVVADRYRVVLFAVPSSGRVNTMIRITGIGDHDRPEWLIRISGMRSKERRIKRWEHEGVLETMRGRLDAAPEKMELRRQTVEHPFGTIKAWMGAMHFLTKTLRQVSTEMSLHVLAYNLKRVMKVLGVVPLMKAMQA
jgi:hypothetical protein